MTQAEAQEKEERTKLIVMLLFIIPLKVI